MPRSRMQTWPMHQNLLERIAWPNFVRIKAALQFFAASARVSRLWTCLWPVLPAHQWSDLA